MLLTLLEQPAIRLRISIMPYWRALAGTRWKNFSHLVMILTKAANVQTSLAA